MLNSIRHLLIGSPLPTHQLKETRLRKIRALAAFSPDALSSIAYSNQEIYLGLAAAGSAGLALSIPVGLTILGLLVVVSISYYQTIHAYPTGGGSYVVARENLGRLAGLIAGAALLIDYTLTAAVSLTAGISAVTAAFSSLLPYRVPLALTILLIITLMNLRGIRETGTFMAIPVYLFVASFMLMLLYGLIRAIGDGPGSLETAAPAAGQALTAIIVLRAFSSGCTALTGIEAISNGVPVFQEPAAKNAGRTLVIMAILMGTLFAGTIGLTQYFAIVPVENETILAALVRHLFGQGAAFYIIQLSTLLILAVAANTSFTGFPTVAANLARDGFLPHQLRGVGDRLVFSNGIWLLSFATTLLIIGFRGETHALIPLFAVGAFLAFTLSQAGMVVRWWRKHNKKWLLKAGLNGVGAAVTGLTLIIVGVSKFVQGAWITILVIPILIFIFRKINHHYLDVAEQLRMAPVYPVQAQPTDLRVVVPIAGVHRGDIYAVEVARMITKHVTCVFIELEPGTGERLRRNWNKFWPTIPFVIVPSPYRSIIGPLLEFLDANDAQYDDGQLAAVLLPEFIPAKWWHGLLHNQTAWLIKTALLYRRRHLGYQRVIIDVPFHLEH